MGPLTRAYCQRVLLEKEIYLVPDSQHRAVGVQIRPLEPDEFGSSSLLGLCTIHPVPATGLTLPPRLSRNLIPALSPARNVFDDSSVTLVAIALRPSYFARHRALDAQLTVGGDFLSLQHHYILGSRLLLDSREIVIAEVYQRLWEGKLHFLAHRDGLGQ